MSKKSIWFAMATVALTIIGFASKVQAVGIDYRTTEIGVPQKGISSGEQTLNYPGRIGDTNDLVSIPNRSIDSELDPTLEVWQDLATDTDKFSNIYDVNDDDLSQIAFVSNEIAMSIADESNQSFTLPTSEGYTIAVTPNNSNDTTKISDVPEPLTILGSLTAIGFGGFLKRKYSLKSHLEEKS